MSKMRQKNQTKCPKWDRKIRQNVYKWYIREADKMSKNETEESDKMSKKARKNIDKMSKWRMDIDKIQKWDRTDIDKMLIRQKRRRQMSKNDIVPPMWKCSELSDQSALIIKL